MSWLLVEVNCGPTMQGTQKQDDVSASVIPVRLRNGVVALESSFRGGIKREVLRSLCQVSANRAEVVLYRSSWTAHDCML